MTRSGLVFLAIFIAALAPIEDADAADAPVVRCVDAFTGSSIECDAEVTSPRVFRGWSSSNPTKLLPPLRVELRHTGYLPRTVELSAGFLLQNRSPIFAMVRELPANTVPTLGTIREFDRLEQGRKLDRALAIVELLEDRAPAMRRGGTYRIKYMNARHVAYFKACTLLLYISCDRAESATKELIADIELSQEEYAAAGLRSAGMNKYIEDARIASFNELYARASWFKNEDAFAEATQVYEEALRELKKLDRSVAARTGMTTRQIERDIEFMHSRMVARGLAVAQERATPLVH